MTVDRLAAYLVDRRDTDTTESMFSFQSSVSSSADATTRRDREQFCRVGSGRVGWCELGMRKLPSSVRRTTTTIVADDK